MLVQNTYIHMISLFVALIGGSCWLVYGILNKDVHYALRTTCILVGILSIYIMFDKHVYLPFLGESAIPSRLLVSDTPTQVDVGNSKNVIVKLRDLPKNTKVVYWAAQKASGKGIVHWQEAYGDYQNSGIASTDEKGEVTFSIACPQPYHVLTLGLFKKRIPPHIHYRFVLPGTGGSMLSEVYTASVLC